MKRNLSVSKIIIFGMCVGLMLAVVTLVYYLLGTSHASLEIPQKRSKDIFESNILNKVIDPDEQEFLLSVYIVHEDGSYHLSEDLSDKEQRKVRLILDNGGYYSDLRRREIETGPRSFLNGHMGPFFRFKFVGNVGWLVIPVIFCLFLKYSKRTSGERFLLVIYLVSSVFICVLFYFNHRYQLTLLPLTFVLLFTAMYNVMKKVGYGKFTVPLFVVFLLMSVFNTFYFRNWFVKKASVTGKDVIEGGSEARDEGMTLDGIVELFRDTDRKKIAQHLENIGLGSEDCVIVNNLPFIYYYSDIPAVYYWANTDVYYVEDGYEYLLLDRSFEDAARFITDELECPYIISTYGYNEYSNVFKEFLEEYTDVEYSSGDYVIYQVKQL